MHHVATPADTAIIMPNSDTPYSILWLDLRAEPMVISAPAITRDRYYSVQLIDGNTYNFGYIGTRATGTEAGDYLVVGPDWKGAMPSGIKKVFRSTTPFVFANFRTQLFNPSDMPNVEKVQSGYKALPLSAFLNQPAPPAAPKIEFLLPVPGSRTTSFSISTRPCNSSPRRDKAIRTKLARIASARAGPSTSRICRLNDWLKRAGAGIYGNDAVEAMYPFTRTSATGETLDASKHNYTITFPPDSSRR